MNVNNLIQMTIASVIVILVTVTVAVPIISELAIVTTDGSNTDASFYMEKFDGTDFTITNDSGTIKVGDFNVSSVISSGSSMIGAF